MLFQKRVDRAMEHSAKNRAKNQGPVDPDEFYDPKADREEPTLKDSMEKGDFFAMIVSALLVLVPISLAVLLIMVLVGRLVLHIW